jgi:hypothetical protein
VCGARDSTCTCPSLELRRSLRQLVTVAQQCSCCSGLLCVRAEGALTGSCASAPTAPGIASVVVIPELGSGGLATIRITLTPPVDTGGVGEAPLPLPAVLCLCFGLPPGWRACRRVGTPPAALRGQRCLRPVMLLRSTFPQAPHSAAAAALPAAIAAYTVDGTAANQGGANVTLTSAGTNVSSRPPAPCTLTAPPPNRRHPPCSPAQPLEPPPRRRLGCMCSPAVACLLLMLA